MSKDWQDIEKLIQLINISIEPESKVEHDVQMPVINSPSNRSRQCDLVIYSGPKHRRTITLFEIQNRTSKVDINTFNGWLLKLEEVGAQHLVCVSRLEFPESIKEKALSSGNKVKLITLSLIEKDKIPLDLFKMKFKYVEFNILESNHGDLAYSKSETEALGIYDSVKEYAKNKSIINFSEKVFSYDKLEVISLYDICKKSVGLLQVDKIGIQKLDFRRDSGQPLYLFIDGKFIHIKLVMEIKWENKTIEYPVSILSYEQLIDGSLAWVFEGQNETPSGPISFKIPIIKKGSHYQIAGIMTSSSFDVELLLTKQREENQNS